MSGTGGELRTRVALLLAEHTADGAG